jgi:DNA invertase Pin-like site-specific DNA recombinase
VVYVRQSTVQQVLDHQESTRLQYGLRVRACELGWSAERVVVIDDDLGKSGATVEGRVGFQRLVSEVSLDHVGIILGVEMSRLARSGKDWHQLLELCALFRTLLADTDGVYDPAHYNDRLLLGLKGTLSEAELHVLKQRMHQGKLNKARRGELALRLPIGYGRRPSGEAVFDPDAQVQQVVRLVFRKFEELGTLNAVLRYLVTHDIRLGVRIRGELEWHRPNRMILQNLLKNPVYAGAYAYGRRQVDPRKKRPGRPSTGRVVMDPQDWVVLRTGSPSCVHLLGAVRGEPCTAAGEPLARGGDRHGALGGGALGGTGGLWPVWAPHERVLRRVATHVPMHPADDRLRRRALPGGGWTYTGRLREQAGTQGP